MENIKIENIERKDNGLVVVKYNGGKSATLNTKWQSNEVFHLENHVKVGGSANVEIVQKGAYMNITKVDMSIEVNPSLNVVPKGTPVDLRETPVKPLKDDSIVAQVFMKGAVEMYCSETGTIEKRDEYLAECVQDLHDAYKLGVGLLEQD